MGKVSKREVEHIALLSRLKFSESEKAQMAQHLTNVSGHFETLDNVDTSSVEPMAHLLNNVNVLREDVPFVFHAREELLKNAADADGEYYIVPKVLE